MIIKYLFIADNSICHYHLRKNNLKNDFSFICTLLLIIIKMDIDFRAADQVTSSERTV